MTAIPVVDLFAGPGGLNEGFCSLEAPDGSPVFATTASIEVEAAACETLRLRSAVRQLRQSATGYERYREFLRGQRTWDDFAAVVEVQAALKHGRSEVHQLELGPANRAEASEIIKASLRSAEGEQGLWVLLGGPPCQAYSLVGRARRTRDAAFEDDVKHFLYREYLDIIDNHRPPVFVMENVKGLLSSTHGGQRIFSRILDDLTAAGGGYDVRSFVVNNDASSLFSSGLAPEDFIIRAEQYGVPQRRHRVILLGVRQDLASVRSKVLTPEDAPTVRQVIEHLPHLRSYISPRRDDDERLWHEVRVAALEIAKSRKRRARETATGWARGGPGASRQDHRFERWLTRGDIGSLVQHEARGHMTKDLMRYAFLAAKAEEGKAVKIGELPEVLMPRHANARRADAPFADRFRVQGWDNSSTTITSHIAKDGHYYIHPDPGQMRSLTVREAARLQSFPDDYFFWGNRTQQYHQVGNAVPPYLAWKLAGVVADLLGLTT